MTEPTPIKSHRRYTKRKKTTVMIAAELTSVPAAAEAHGVPERTIRHWREKPELAELAAKTRADLADEMKVLAQLAASELMAKVQKQEIDPRDLIILLGVSIDKGQLLAGEATARNENRDLTDGMDDHERVRLKEVLREAIEVSE